MFSKYPFWWDRVGIDFNGRVPGYSHRRAIIGDFTKISTFTNLKRTQILGFKHLLYFLSVTLFTLKAIRQTSVHSKHCCLWSVTIKIPQIGKYPVYESFTTMTTTNKITAFLRLVESHDLSVKHLLLLECFGI